MPKAQKAVVGQNKKPIHPNSRKAMVLMRKYAHDLRRQKSQSRSAMKLSSLVEKFQFIKDELDEERAVHTRQEMAEIIERHLHRFDSELEQIAIVNSIGHRQGQRHAARETAINATIQQEENEFKTIGTEVPDLTTEEKTVIFRWERISDIAF